MRLETHPNLRIDFLSFQKDGLSFRVPRLLADRFEITGLLAAGGFGVVYIAKDRRIFHRKVLIKANRYSPSLFSYPNNKELQRVLHEQRSRLRHEADMLCVALRRKISGTPVLIDLIDSALSLDLFGPHTTPEGRSFTLPSEIYTQEPYLILSFIDGEPLHRACLHSRFTRDLLANTKTLALQIAAILQEFHRLEDFKQQRLSFIYQDLKPENIVWTSTREAFLIDFGSFAVRTPDLVDPANALISTPPYEPPEFAFPWSNEEIITPQADIFSLGVTVLHLLLGRAPVDPSTGEPALTWDSLSLPPSWSSWLAKATASDPKLRFSSMKDSFHALLALETPERL